MEEKKEGYNRYKVIFDNIRALCNVLDRPKKVIEGPLEGITEETCECDCKYYILGNGLHVYIRGEYIYISENDVQYWGDERGRKGEELRQFYVSFNKGSIDCVCHADSGRPHTLVQYFNHELDENMVLEETYGGRDNVCIPQSFENWNITFGTSEYVSGDIGRAISLHMGENIKQDVRDVCDKIIALNEKIKEYEREPYQELFKSEEALLELKEALQELKKEVQGISDNENEIEGKLGEIKEKKLEIECLEKNIKRIRDKINQILDEIQVPGDVEQNDEL